MDEPTTIMRADVCVYGATSAGIAAALCVARAGKSVALIESGAHLGGLTTGGLGATDIGSKGVVGGIAREFYERVHAHYRDSPDLQDDAKRGTPDPLVEQTGRPTKWTFEPSAAMSIYKSMLQSAGVEARFEQPLKRVETNDARIVEVETETGQTYRAAQFIDASYEGDLMARAGVSYFVGRESNESYGETLNGVRPQTPHHQFHHPVDPYNEPGDPTSGLLPYIEDEPLAAPGSGDHRVQAYNYRLCLTQRADNRVAWAKPEGYDPHDYELLARHIEASIAAGRPVAAVNWGGLMNPVAMPGGKTDTNNSGAFSTDFIGCNYDYPDGDYALRERIRARHQSYIRGFCYFLATSERVPARIRDEMATWGMAADEFVQNDNFPTQIYVREARRMVTDFVINENDCRGQRTASDPVALAAYQIDSHNCQRTIRDGLAHNEGDVQSGTAPFPISYRALAPRRGECQNLLVPVCLAASHVAFGSIRMEPVFMILGQSAALAALLALRSDCPTQDVDYAELRRELERNGQVTAVPSA